MSDTMGLVQIVEASLLAAGKPLTVAQLGALFEDHERPANDDIRNALEEVKERCEGRGYELIEVASGFRFQVREQLSPWVGRLWQERPQKYSRALLETLSLIAYRQPITRGEIEEIRGVAVSTNIIRTLHERDWIRVVGHRDVPGRPSMYATTRQFLDYFNLKSLDQLPALADIRDLETLNAELGFSEPLPEELREPDAAGEAEDGDPEAVPTASDADETAVEEGDGTSTTVAASSHVGAPQDGVTAEADEVAEHADAPEPATEGGDESASEGPLTADLEVEEMPGPNSDTGSNDAESQHGPVAEAQGERGQH